MENLCNVSRKIVDQYKKYKFIYSEHEKEVFASLVKFQKVLDMIGEEDKLFLESTKKFWEKNKDNFLKNSWDENVVKFHLYNQDGIIKGPLFYLSDLSYLAKEVDEQRPLNSKVENLKTRLDKALFKVISSVDEEFGKKQVTSGEVNALPFDFSKLGDVIGKIVDSGVISNSDKVDKEELMSAVNSFVSNPKLGEIFGSIVQTLGGKDANISTETFNEVLSGVKKEN